ncbi:MAG: high-potential iron-sulfur protein [Hyphomicrobiales bacterium]
MREATQICSLEISRRCLLRGATRGLGAATVLGMMSSPAMASKIPQSAVAYRSTPNAAQHCDNCRLWEAPNACKTVDGTISPQGWCRIYVKA